MSSIRVDQGDMSLSGGSGETGSMPTTLRRQERVTRLIGLPGGLGSPELPRTDTPMSIDLRERLNVMMQNYNCTSCPFPEWHRLMYANAALGRVRAACEATCALVPNAGAEVITVHNAGNVLHSVYSIQIEQMVKKKIWMDQLYYSYYI